MQRCQQMRRIGLLPKSISLSPIRCRTFGRPPFATPARTPIRPSAAESVCPTRRPRPSHEPKQRSRRSQRDKLSMPSAAEAAAECEITEQARRESLTSRSSVGEARAEFGEGIDLTSDDDLVRDR